MRADRVEELCTHLSILLKNTIRRQILKYKEPPSTYAFGEALIFWLADWLSGIGFLNQDQLRLVVEEFSEEILDFGAKLEMAWEEARIILSPDTGMPTQHVDRLKLPSCKIGFLDRALSCMDGCDSFVDLTTGERKKATDTKPLETIAYNLTALFIRYNDNSRINITK